MRSGLVGGLGKLLDTYRQTPPDKREEVLLAAMQEIKSQPKARAVAHQVEDKPTPVPAPVAVTPSETPPFSPDNFTPSWDWIAAIPASDASWLWN